MGLKGTKAMFALAKAEAIRKDVRTIGTEYGGKLYAGYGLTQNEISNLFLLESFTREATIRKYEQIWQQCGWTVRAANGFLFFILDEIEDKAAIRNLKDASKDLAEQGNPDCIFVTSEVSA